MLTTLRRQSTQRPPAHRSARRRRRLHAAGVLLLAVAATAAGHAEPARRHLLVRFERSLGAEERRLVAGLRGHLRAEMPEVSAAAITLPAHLVGALRDDPRVALVEADPWRYPANLNTKELVPSPTNGLYGLVLTGALAAQQRGSSGQGVAVCVVDSGIDAAHPDLAAAYRGGIDTVDGDNDPDVGNHPTLGDHGTRVAGVVLAAVNGKGVRGVAPQAHLYHGRALGAEGGRSSDIMAAVRSLVRDHGCRVVNLSLGSDEPSQIEESFYAELVAEHDVLVVAAAGNDGRDGVSYPGAYPRVFAVGAVDRHGALASFSNRGAEIALAAPGVAVLSSAPRGNAREATLAVGQRSFGTQALVYSGFVKLLRKKLVECGNGNTPDQFPRAVRGQIALVRRGDATFATKTENAMDAGALAVIVTNNVEGEDAGYTLGTPTVPGDGRTWVPVLFVSRADGDFLRARKPTVKLTSTASHWAAANGTSFAAPHVTGAAALVLAVAPHLTRDELAALLVATAVDLGAPGRDDGFGAGLVDVDAAIRAADG